MQNLYKTLNNSNITKWFARVLITFNFIFAVVVKTSVSEYYVEGFPLIIIAIWLTWFNNYVISVLIMLLCISTFYMHWQ
ncbi:hypothetical protein Q764_06200 [Flavobacterium suncheonense GH29-5 = DSM 17707]|uniref:Histidine kinase n=1 Tax=Flavobacterium suncheonense GH29-5 = DSM 17707 TaxID=1121899 RepID=A0A0A2MBY2_9FLAO|nr:hypothetical protein Q764_06200 [Flavobacterium suncheonense GH29-5 = DSM 17707]